MRNIYFIKSVAKNCHSFIPRHRKLHPVPGGHVQRKHPRVNLRRLLALVPQQALQRGTGVLHVHGVAVPEGVQGDRYGEAAPL